MAARSSRFMSLSIALWISGRFRLMTLTASTVSVRIIDMAGETPQHSQAWAFSRSGGFHHHGPADRTDKPVGDGGEAWIARPGRDRAGEQAGAGPEALQRRARRL